MPSEARLRIEQAGKSFSPPTARAVPSRDDIFLRYEAANLRRHVEKLKKENAELLRREATLKAVLNKRYGELRSLRAAVNFLGKAPPPPDTEMAATVDRILGEICKKYNIPMGAVQGRTRRKGALIARAEACYRLSVEVPHLSYPSIAALIGYSDHSTPIKRLAVYCRKHGLPYPSRKTNGDRI
jgi:chromosomal replication initiation ATPase DnaA